VIRNWTLGHVVSAQDARVDARVEQNSTTSPGSRAYMTHPIHWGLVDGWFDPECPQRIVDRS